MKSSYRQLLLSTLAIILALSVVRALTYSNRVEAPPKPVPVLPQQPTETVTESLDEDLHHLSADERNLFRNADDLDRELLRAVNYTRAWANELDEDSSEEERAEAQHLLERLEAMLLQMKARFAAEQ